MRPRRALHLRFRSKTVRVAAAIAFYLLAIPSIFGGVFWNELTSSAPMSVQETPNPLFSSDQRFSIWVTARNAAVLASRPSQILEANQCYPQRGALTLGHPCIATGLLAVPAYLATGDPIATYNAALAMLALTSAMAMFWLIWSWTGVYGAALVAGALYGFHPALNQRLVWPFHFDTLWLVLALLFAQRLFARGRWTDAAALALCVALQIAESAYSLIAAGLIAIPMTLWLVVRYGLTRARAVQFLAVAAFSATAAALILDPFLAAHQDRVLVGNAHVHLRWVEVLPGGAMFPGWLSISLVVVALAAGRKRIATAIQGDPRWMLLLGCICALVLSTGGNAGDRVLGPAGDSLPVLANPFEWLESVVPSLAFLRAPALLLSGVHVSLSLLAGLGTAVLIRLGPVPGTRAVISALLVTTVFGVTMAPTLLGFDSSVVRMEKQRPREVAIRFYEELAELGDAGPIFEWPRLPALAWAHGTSARLLLSAYHGRKTSSCYNSTSPSVSPRLREIGSQLPASDAVAALRELGFATIVIHHQSRPGPLVRHFEAAAADGDAIEFLHSARGLSAYRILPVERTAR